MQTYESSDVSEDRIYASMDDADIRVHRNVDAGCQGVRASPSLKGVMWVCALADL